MAPSENAPRNRKVMAIVAGSVLVGLAASLTFVVTARERHCAPLELEFQILSRTSPERQGSWDVGSSSVQAPDPTGWVSVITKGERYGESIAQRKNTYDFRGRFYSRRGVPLARGSTIKVSLLDKDLGSAEGLGEIEHTVWLPAGGSAISSNGIVELVYTCHTDSTAFEFFSSLW